MAIIKQGGAEMLGVLVYDGRSEQRMFDPTANPDGLNAKWIALRDGFAAHGIRLIPAGDLERQKPVFELHVNAKNHSHSSCPTFAILTECALIHPPNGDRNLLRRYQRVFTWNDELVETGLAVKIQLGHPLSEGTVDGGANRPCLITMIAANKALPSWRPDFDLYRERVRTIRWFERHAPHDFALYGRGWDKSPRLPTHLGGLVHRLEGLLPMQRCWFPSWRGTVRSKREVLACARFSIVYENVRNLQGYITEKIFDAMCAGCVPVYWGASNIMDYIPSDCFIDRRLFPNHEALYAFLKGMPEHEYLRYQEAIRAFLASPAATPFSAEAFAATVVGTIVRDLQEQGIEI
jgi:hypothetical protein